MNQDYKHELNTDILLNILNDEVLPNLTNEELVNKMMSFRKRNFTSQGIYCYLLYSTSDNKIFQDDIRSKIKNRLGDMNNSFCEKYNEIINDYYSFLSDIAEDEGWFDEEMEEMGIKNDGSDLYYETFWDMFEESLELENPYTLLDLVMFELIMEYIDDELPQRESVLQDQIDEVIESLDLIDNFGYICVHEDDEKGLEYTIEFNYDTLEYDIYNTDSLSLMTMDEIKETLINLKKDLVESK